MKVLSVLNPTLDDYKLSGAALLGINIGEYMNRPESCTIHSQVDYIASEAIKDLISSQSTVYTPNVRKSRCVSDTIEYAVKIFYENNYDVMHVHLHQMSVLSAIKNLVPKDLPVVYTQHSSTILGRFSLGYRPDAYELSKDGSRKIKIACPSGSMWDIWNQYIDIENPPTYEKVSGSPDNTCLVRNGIPMYPDVSRVLPIADSSTYISCGRIDPNKGMLDVAKLCVKYKHKVILIGDLAVGSMKVSGDMQRYYDEFVELCENNKDLIKWFRYLPNKDIRRLMSKCRAYISMSRKESFGLTVAEAMSVGLPVLYLQESAITEIVGVDAGTPIYLDRLYRKSMNKRLDIYEESLKYLNELIDKKLITSETVLQKFDFMNLSIRDCARRYYLMYEDVIK